MPGRFLLALLIFALVLLPIGRARGEGVLAQIRREVEQGTETDPESCDEPKRRRPSEYDDYDDQSPWRDFIGTALLMTITSPFWGPPVWLGDTYQSQTYLSCFPYQHNASGFVLLDPPHDLRDQFLWSLRVRGEYADDFDSLTRYGGRVLWESRNRIGIDTSVDYHREALANGRHDDLWTGDANVVFRFAQSERLMMRSGLGANYLSADHGTDLGINFTYAADWFPMQPWIVSAEIDWGRLGAVGLFHSRTTIGVNVQNVEIYAGFSYLDVGDSQIRGVVSGIQLWY